ncbi:MAG: hypothetical protein R3C69_04515 [Geminicoccaceae bacterium]
MQAGGGNTSLKVEGTLWVQASGFWPRRRHAERPLRAGRHRLVLDAIDGGDETTCANRHHRRQEPQGAPPSIETSLHALLPHRFVVRTIRSGRSPSPSAATPRPASPSAWTA